MAIAKHCIRFTQNVHDTRLFAIAAASLNFLETPLSLQKQSVILQTQFHTRSNCQSDVLICKFQLQEVCSKILKIRSSKIDLNRNYTALAREIEKKSVVTYEASPKILTQIPLNLESRTSQTYRNISDDSKNISPNNNKSTEKINPSPVTSKKDQFKKAIKDYGSVVVIFHLTLSWGSLGLLYFLISRYVYTKIVFPLDKRDATLC